jgi:hypothetical protein
VDRRAAAYGAAALTTMPLFFVRARSMLGDAVAMSANAAAFAGLSVAIFDRGHARPERTRRFAALALGVGGLLAGASSRGAAIGVAAPALGIGLAWAAVPRGARDTLADVTGTASLLTGAIAVVLALRAAPPATSHPLFDAVYHRLGHALFPWSALLPLAFVALLANSPARGEHARASVLACAVAAFAAHTLGIDGRDTVPFSGPAILAAGLAIAARDLDRLRSGGALGASLRDRVAARAATLAAALLVILLARDLAAEPARARSPRSYRFVPGQPSQAAARPCAPRASWSRRC